ncbi:MAG: prolyl oligopeptidase family serine peptidase [Caulobacteraceae bacterium]
MALAAAVSPPPPTARIPVTDTYHGVAVSDPYRWLEDAQDPKVKAWSAAQNARARGYLDSLPERAPIRSEVARITRGASVSYSGLAPRGGPGGGQVFAEFHDPARQQAMVVVMDASADPASQRIVVDPNRMDPSGHTAIDWWSASPDGELVAVSISHNGSEDGDLHVYRVSTGEEVGAAIPHVQYPTAGGSLAWAPGSDAFWYTRYPGEGTPAVDRHYNLQVYFHRLGANWSADPLALGTKDGLERISEIFLANPSARPAIVAMVQRGDGGQYAQYLLSAPGGAPAAPIRLSGYDDKIVSAVVGPDDAVYGVSLAGALNGKIVKASGPFGPGALAAAPVIVAEAKASIRIDGAEANIPSLVLTPDRLFARYMVGGPTEVRVFDHAGKPAGAVPTPPVTDVEEIDPMADGTVLFDVSSYIEPRYFARWTPATDQVTRTALVQTSPADFSDAEVRRVFATSKDGTKVPLNVIMRKGTRLDGASPLLLYGYGGYGINETPRFLGPMGRAWLDGGGIYVDANLRGGGEYGEAWHRAGSLLNKQNVFDDFDAAAEYLIAQGYTAHDRLALLGGSNGGLLMGATITQHPALARAVVSAVGIYDMLRVELDPNGAFNTTEFGSVKDAAQFRALYAYSPYHHVRAGAPYPAVLLTAGDNDGRVNPLNSRKFMAALQYADPDGRPLLLRTSSTSGHGIGDSLDERIDRTTDMVSFLFDQLHMTLKPN